MISEIPTESLIAELRRRRALIDAALNTRTHQHLISVVAGQWGISPDSLFTKSRARKITEARQSVMVILREKGETFQAIGDLFHMDYGTAIHAVSTHQKRMNNRHFAARFNASEKLIFQHQHKP